MTHTPLHYGLHGAWLAGLGLMLCATGCSMMPTPAATAPASAAAAASSPGPNALAQQSAVAGLVARGAAPPSTAASAAALPGAAAAAAASGLRPFADVIKDAKRIDGLFTLWQKDDRVWMELKPGDFNQPFFLSPKYKTGIGEGMFLGGLMLIGGETVIEFRRIYNQVQLLAKNTEFIAKANTPTGRAVDLAFSPSLLASAAVLSQPHPERKSVLVEVNSLFVNDMLGTALALQRTYRQGYVLDPRNSAITAVRATPDLVVLEVLSHFATGSISVPQPGTPPGMPAPSLPRSLPDPRSLFMTLHYSLARLPEQVMAPRKADSRIGHFSESVSDFTDDLQRSPRQRFIQRWRLEKKDATAELSEPVKPITFWLDRTIPEKYRAPITAGVLEWNKAFEKIGFKDVMRVEVQPDDAEWDTLDFGRNSIHWMVNANPSFTAIGPRHVDPRSGEILDADIGVESLSFRSQRALRTQVLGVAGAIPEEPALRGMRGFAQCDYAEQAAEQMSYAMDVLEARGDMDPSGPLAEKFVYDFLKDTTMHEVGHTLGLRHNFRASRVFTDAQLSDPAFTAANGVSGSVMEYAAINLAAPGQPPEQQGSPFSTTLGPYDYWAIEYAYKPLPAAEEDAELGRIARRSSEPWLAYGTDEDNYLGIDPESLQFDLGADVIAFARKRIAIGRDLLARQESRQLPDDQDYSVLRRSVNFALRDMARAAGALTRQIGGVRTLRDHAGSGRDPLLPVPASEQRMALDVLATGFLSADSVRISPALQRKMALDFLERSDSVSRGEGSQGTDFSFSSQVVDLQRGVVAQLMSDSVSVRLLDSEDKSPKDALRLSELYSRLNTSIWSELALAGDISPLRRELQRDHVNRLAGLLLHPAALSRADARSLLRAQTQTLQVRIAAATRRGGLSEEAKAHLQDSADTLAQALSARLQRGGI